METEDQRTKLAAELATAPWTELRPHAERDQLFLVGEGLELLEAGVALANDEAMRVQGWIEAGQLTRPTAAQLEAWEQASPAFRFLILAPFVVAEPADV